MDLSAVKAIVEKHLRFIAWDLQVNRWIIRVEYCTLSAGVAGTCSPLVAYQSAKITLDPAMFDDEAGVLETLRHELLHIVAAEFFSVNDVAFEMLKPRDRKAFEVVWRSAMERTIRAMEQMLDHGLCIPAGKREGAPEVASSDPYADGGDED